MEIVLDIRFANFYQTIIDDACTVQEMIHLHLLIFFWIEPISN